MRQNAGMAIHFCRCQFQGCSAVSSAQLVLGFVLQAGEDAQRGELLGNVQLAQKGGAQRDNPALRIGQDLEGETSVQRTLDLAFVACSLHAWACTCISALDLWAAASTSAAAAGFIGRSSPRLVSDCLVQVLPCGSAVLFVE